MLIKKILKSIKMIFKLRCPKCGGIMDWKMIDMQFDKNVYKCRDCGKEWI